MACRSSSLPVLWQACQLLSASSSLLLMRHSFRFMLLLLSPQMILRFLQNSSCAFLSGISGTLLGVLANQWFYGVAYFFLVFIFTYFYTAVTFDPDQISTNLQKNGAFIPGVRPGHSTS